MFFKIQPNAEPEVDLSVVYDALIVGPGAAGGMAAHVLTSQAMKVLFLGAGKKINTSEVYPYELNPGVVDVSAIPEF
ncbi:MAG: hypothetical protein ACR2JB_16940 [Bryobacteraceae bacterium]